MNKRKTIYSILLADLLAGIIIFGLSACGQTQSATAAQTERDVTYPGTGGVTLAGTLLIPAHPQGQRVPAALIVAGSGATDRNGNEPGAGVTTDVYQQIAEQLAQQGIASLRYDKRGVGASTPVPLPKNPNQPTPAEVARVQDFAAWANYVADAQASLTYLQQQPEIDPAHIALIGHSEGGYIVEQVASMEQTAGHPVAALVLISAPGRTYDVVFREQVVNLLAREDVSANTTAFVLSKYDEIIAGIKQNGHTPPAALQALRGNPDVPMVVVNLLSSSFSAYNDKFWQGALQVNPTALVAAYPGPVLVLQGEKDTQVFASQDTPLLDAALKSRKPDDHEIVLVPGASHFLKLVQPGDPQSGISGPIVASATNTLRSWLAAKLSAGTTLAASSLALAAASTN